MSQALDTALRIKPRGPTNPEQLIQPDPIKIPEEHRPLRIGGLGPKLPCFSLVGCSLDKDFTLQIQLIQPNGYDTPCLLFFASTH